VASPPRSSYRQLVRSPRADRNRERYAPDLARTVGFGVAIRVSRSLASALLSIEAQFTGARITACIDHVQKR